MFYKCIANICGQMQVLLLNGWPPLCFHMNFVNSFEKELGYYFLTCCYIVWKINDETADMFVFINSHRF